MAGMAALLDERIDVAVELDLLPGLRQLGRIGRQSRERIPDDERQYRVKGERLR